MVTKNKGGFVREPGSMCQSMYPSKRHQKDSILDYPLVPSQVNVSVGDWVEVGQVLALVDTEQTVSAMASIQKNIGNTDFSALLAGSSFDEKISDFPEQIIANATGTITSLSFVIQYGKRGGYNCRFQPITSKSICK